MKLILKLGLLAAVLTMCVGQSAPALALSNPSLPASGCLGGKIKCVIKKKACLLGLYKKSATPDPLAIAKCKDKFQVSPSIGKGCFEKLDAKNATSPCVTLGDAGAMEAKIDAHVDDLVAELYPTTPGNKCAFGKTACVLKYNSCVLGLFSKAAKAGGTIDGTKLPKCTDGLTACIGKLETKYCDPSTTVGCTSTAPPCLTFTDLNALRNKDDAFIDDVVAELAAGKDQNNQRCTNDTSVHCATAPGGGGCGGGTCEFWFGSPLSLAAGGVTTCVTNQWAGGISGTFDQQGGASVGTASVLARVYNGILVANPCPRCIGDNFPADGAKGGTCNGGQRNGLTCDKDGQSPEPSFGTSSLDCPPTAAGIIATIPVDLTNTNNGSVSKVVDGTSPNCNGAAGKKCVCATCSLNASIGCDHDADCAAVAAGTCTNNAGEPRKPNACVDDTAIPGDGTICTVDGGGEGHCAEGPPNQHCHIETFRGCTMPADCPAAGDSCDADIRDCFPGSGNGIGDSVTAVGSHEGPRNHAGVQTFGSVFCAAHTSAAAVNSVAGLPGPGRLALKGVGAENGTAVACPTVATFLPTTKLGVLDTGWTGISHDAKVIGGGKVTVGVTGCAAGPPNCGVCTYTGPVPNPNAVP
jgi:hypothetical protein